MFPFVFRPVLAQRLFCPSCKWSTTSVPKTGLDIKLHTEAIFFAAKRRWDFPSVAISSSSEGTRDWWNVKDWSAMLWILKQFTLPKTIVQQCLWSFFLWVVTLKIWNNSEFNSKKIKGITSGFNSNRGSFSLSG